MKQPLLSELDKVFPLSHKVQHFCNSSCPTEQNACCCACFCCCTQICLDFRVNLFFFFLFLIFFFLSTARWGFKLLLLCWKGIEICRAFKKEKHSPPRPLPLRAVCNNCIFSHSSSILKTPCTEQLTMYRVFSWDLWSVVLHLSWTADRWSRLLFWG